MKKYFFSTVICALVFAVFAFAPAPDTQLNQFEFVEEFAEVGIAGKCFTRYQTSKDFTICDAIFTKEQSLAAIENKTEILNIL